jgi:hypothetical protein
VSFGRRSEKRSWWIALALIPVAILILQFPVSLPVWNLLPKLRLLQFPWRWLVVLEAPMAIFIASTIWPSGASLRWRRMVVAAACGGVFLACTIVSGIFFFQVCDEEDAVAPMLDTYRSGAGFAGTDEYEPPGADNSLVATGLPFACLVNDPSTALGVLPKGSESDGSNPAWEPGQGSCDATFGAGPDRSTSSPEHLRVAAVAAHSGYLVLRLRSYPAWRIMVNGQQMNNLPRREDGLMAVVVARGPVDLTLDWSTTGNVLAGRWVSLLALLALIALCLVERKMWAPRLS